MKPSRAALLGSVFLTIAAVLLIAHAQLIRAVRETGLPAALVIPELEKRLTVLREQVEVSELQRSLSEGSADELVTQFILPSAVEIDRVIVLVELLRARLQDAKVLRNASGLRIGKEETLEHSSGIRALPVSFDAEMTEEGLRAFIAVIDLTGHVTVGDVFSSEEIRSFLAVTEQENPASVATVEHFLSLPLLSYAREPKPYEEQVLRSFASPAFERSLRQLLQSSILASARERLSGGLARALMEAKLWPMRFVTLDTIDIEPTVGGWMKVEVELSAYARQL